MVRDLATQPGTLFYRIFTDPLGRILDVTELGRFPSNKLKTAVDIRDGTCRFPTCPDPPWSPTRTTTSPTPEDPPKAQISADSAADTTT